MRVHFIGIGGIGVSGLAKFYLEKGHKVSGSDLIETEITKALKKEGAKVFIGKHKASNIKKDINLVVFTLAVDKNNPELKRAKKLKIKIKTYPQALGDLTKKYFTITISGTHGKSTTSSMVAVLLRKAGFDPTVLIGTKLKEFKDSNCRVGKSKYLVIEADEYKGAFLNYWPKVIILTSLEKEHLDYFKNEKNIFKTYKKYISHLPEDGILIVNGDDKNIKNKILNIKNKNIKIKKYSLQQKNYSRKIKNVLKVPGTHNVSNALAVLSLAKVLGIKEKKALEALSEYKGAWRRFEIIPACLSLRGTNGQAKLNKIQYTLVSDYGHHPTEIKATLQAAREKFCMRKIQPSSKGSGYANVPMRIRKQRRIILVYQPHQYQRTKLLFWDFVKSFDEADYLILNEIYGVAGREKKYSVSSRDLAEAIRERWSKKFKNQTFVLGSGREKSKIKKTVVFIKKQDDILKELSKIIKKGDIVIVMGAGDIYNLTLALLKKNKK